MAFREKGIFKSSEELRYKDAPDGRKLPADAMFVRDLIKSSEYIEMFQKVFGAAVENEERDIRFFFNSNMRIGIISRKDGRSLLALPDGGHRSLNNAVIQDAEDDNGPALNIIFPRMEDEIGVEVVKLRRGRAVQRAVLDASSTEDKDIVAIADKLPVQSRFREENFHPRPTRIISNELPLTVEVNGRKIHVVDAAYHDSRDSRKKRDDESNRGEIKSYGELIDSEREHRGSIPEVRRFDEEEGLTLEKVEKRLEERYKAEKLEPEYQRVHQEAEEERIREGLSHITQ